MKPTRDAKDLAASAEISERIEALADWRGATLTHLRQLILAADPDIEEEWKWAKATSPGVPVWSRNGIICTGESYKEKVKITFARGASLDDPEQLFNSSLEGNVRRAIDLRRGESIKEASFIQLIHTAVVVNAEALAQRSAKKKSSSVSQAKG